LLPLTAGGWVAWTGWRAAWAWAIALTLGLRLGVGLMLAVAWTMVAPYIEAALSTDTRIYDGLPAYSEFPASIVLGVWQRWDAVHYLNLARLGYFGVSEGDSVFYPLYPLLVRLVAPAAANTYVLAGLIVSTLATVVTLACLYQLADRHYGPDTARWTAAALAAYPAGLFLVAPYTESLFLAFTLAAFLAAEDRRWAWAGVLGALASLTRGPGVFTAIALAWIAWRQWRESRAPRQAVPMALGLALTAGGAVAFLWWRSAAGFRPVAEILRVYSGLEMIDPVRGLYYAVVQLAATPDQITALDMASGLAFAGLVAALVANPRWRRGEWVLYTLANLIVFFSKHSFVASSLQSMSRYVLVLFPCFIVLGDWLSARPPGARFLYLLLSSVGLMLLSVLYALWFFVG
jgi:hypothetical protein